MSWKTFAMSGISGLGEPLPTQPLRASSTEKDGQQGGQYFGGGRRNPKHKQSRPSEKTDCQNKTATEGSPATRPVTENNMPTPIKESPSIADNSSELKIAVEIFNAESIERGKSFRIILSPRAKGGLLLELKHPTSGKYAILGDRDASHIELEAIKTRLNALIEGSSGNLFNDKA